MLSLLVAISCFLSGISVLLLGYIGYRLLNFKVETPELLDFNEVASVIEENKEGIQKVASNLIVDPLFARINGMLGGRAKGINAMMKGLSKDVTTEFGNMIVPGAGPMIEKALDKYPEIKAFLPLLLSRAGDTGGMGRTNITRSTGYGQLIDH